MELVQCVVAMIGTRVFLDQPEAAKTAFWDVAIAIGQAGQTCRTGAAEGADQEAGGLVLEMGGKVELVLPWVGYERSWIRTIEKNYPGRVFVEVFDHQRHPAWRESVERYHPAPSVLTLGARALYARNYGIVEPSEFVVAIPQGDDRGGTVQGMRIGQALGKAVYNVQRREDRSALFERISAWGKAAM